ncbi:MAG: fatty acid desaturase, partial [Candidatus Azotimanducaceae bacterium]
DDNDRLRNTRTVRAAWWERAFIAPYGVNYHLEHHLIVNCPYYKLRAAHRLMVSKGHEAEMEVRQSYRDMIGVAVNA